MGSKKSSNKGLLIYVLVLVGVMILIVTLMQQSTKTASEYTYSEIMSRFDNYQVSEFNFDLGTGELNMTVNNDDGTTSEISYTVPNVTVFLNEIQTGSENYRREYNKLHPDAPLVMEYYKIQDTSWLYNLLPSLVIIIMMVALFVFMMRQMGGGGKINNFSKANVKNTSNKKNTFADVAGADEEKAELAEIVDFLKNPKKYNDIGARIPKGVLLMGPPGTGKTLLAKAVAGEAGVPFFSISGSDFVELYVGVGASRVRDLFETAKKNAPSIIFIDEIDAVGRHRGAGLGGGHDEREQTLNQLLVEMDGFEGNEGVIVIAATNRRDILDPALLRPGRFDRQITVSYPDIKGREEILKVHTKKKPLAPDVSLPTIAKSTAGFTGADLENLVNEAALLAARQDRKAITKEDIEEATIKVIAGPEKKSKVVTPDERRLVAYHEAGHAVVTFLLPTQDKVHQVTIIPRGSAGGMTIHLPEREPSLLRVTAEKLKDEIKVCMGGRVAEELILGIGSAGAISDLQRSTKLAKAMVTKYGFSKKLGPVVYGDDNDEPFVGMGYGQSKGISEKVQAEIDEEVRSIIDECYDGTVQLIKDNLDKLHLVAKALIVHEKLDNDEFEKIMNGETPADKIETEYEEFISSEKEKEEKASESSENEAASDNSSGSNDEGSASAQNYNNIRSYLADKFDGDMFTFYEKISGKIKNDIAVIAPTAKHPYYVLCTLGMSELPMTTPENMTEEEAKKNCRAEAMMLLPPDWKVGDEAFKDEKWYWPVRALKTSASYVHDEKTWIGHGHSLQLTEKCEPFADNTKLCALLFSTLDDESINGFTDAQGNFINVYCTIPIYKEELDEKLADENHGGSNLYSKIYGDNRSLGKLVVDINRKNVCK